MGSMNVNRNRVSYNFGVYAVQLQTKLLKIHPFAKGVKSFIL